VLSPSLTATGEPPPLPMERTSLTVSIVKDVRAAMTDRWPLLQGIGVIAPSDKHSIGTQLLREVSDGCTTTRAGPQDDRTACI
jgi:hypothetical protein